VLTAIIGARRAAAAVRRNSDRAAAEDQRRDRACHAASAASQPGIEVGLAEGERFVEQAWGEARRCAT